MYIEPGDSAMSPTPAATIDSTKAANSQRQWWRSAKARQPTNTARATNISVPLTIQATHRSRRRPMTISGTTTIHSPT
jgi:hypothetical protein